MRNYVRIFAVRGHGLFHDDPNQPTIVYDLFQREIDAKNDAAVMGLTLQGQGYTQVTVEIRRIYVLLNKSDVFGIIQSWETGWERTNRHPLDENWSFLTETPPRRTWSHGH